MPRYEDLVWDGLPFTPEQYQKATHLNPGQWEREMAGHDEFFRSVGEKLPPAFHEIRTSTFH